MTQEQLLQAEIAALKAENEALKNPVKGPRALSFKVSTKGALSVYGLGRFPTTMYKGQWIKLLAVAEQIQAFITANDNALSEKPVKGGTVTSINSGTKAA